MKRTLVALLILLALAALIAGWTWDEDTVRTIAEGSTIIA